MKREFTEEKSAATYLPLAKGSIQCHVMVSYSHLLDKTQCVALLRGPSLHERRVVKICPQLSF